MKKIKVLICMVLLSITMMACSRSNQMIKNETTKTNKTAENEISETKNPKYVRQEPITKISSEVNDKIHKIGEKFTILGIDENDNDVVGMECTVNSAKIYNNPKEAGFKKDQLIEPEVYLKLDPNNPEVIYMDEVMKSKIVVCDLTLKNIALGEENITEFSIMNKGKDGEIVDVGFPIYFSKPKSKSEYYHLVWLKGQTVNVQVAWIIDEKTLQLDESIEKSLYLMSGSDSNAQFEEIVDLGL